MSLKDPRVKMSKSDPDARSRILLNDSSGEIYRKVSAALTDSLADITYDPVGRAGISNLLTIMSWFDQRQRSPEAIAEDCKILSKRDFKDQVVEMIDVGLAPIRERYNLLINRKGLGDAACHGSMQARKRATATMTKVRALVGLT